MENPVTNAEGAAFIQDFQNIAQAAQAIVAEVEEKSGQQKEGQQLTAKEQADFQLKAEKLRQEGIKIGLAVQQNQDLNESRKAKESLQQRSQYTKEINEDRRLKLDKERNDAQAAAQKNKNKK
jgi:hypothetical protein